MGESKLWLAIKRWKRAVRLKAHPRLIEKLALDRDAEAKKLADSLSGDSLEEIVASLFPIDKPQL